MRYFTLFIIVVLLSSSAQAQILNIEKARLDNDSTERLVGNVGASFSLQRRNTRVMSSRITFNASYTSKKQTYISIGNWHWIKIEEADFVSDGYLHFRANFNREKTFSYEVFAQGQYDLIRGMNHRYLVGANLRLDIHESNKFNLSTGLGLMEEWESWTAEDNTVHTALLKINYYLAAQIQFSPIVSFNIGGYYQAKPTTLDEPRITADASINVKVTKRLSFSSHYSLIYDAAPVVPIDRLVYTWVSGVNYSF